MTVLINKVIIAAIGSTAPDKVPYKNAFPLLIPSDLHGSDIAIPSGKFCIAIPIAKTIAAINPDFKISIKS